jgi:hypothetical protein
MSNRARVTRYFTCACSTGIECLGPDYARALRRVGWELSGGKATCRSCAQGAFFDAPDGPPIGFPGSGLREGTTKPPGHCSLHPSGKHCRCTW